MKQIVIFSEITLINHKYNNKLKQYIHTTVNAIFANITNSLQSKFIIRIRIIKIPLMLNIKYKR